MKFIIVTSRITYVNNNYCEFTDELTKRFPKELIGIIEIQNLSLHLLSQILWLYKSHCPHMATTLLKNYNPLNKKSRWKQAEQLGIPILKAKNINDSIVLDWIRNKNVDIIINARARNIFKKDILQIPKIGCINIHHGLLPHHRGIFCDLDALYRHKDAGFTIHQMTSKIDDGIILDKQIVCKKRQITDYQDYLTKSTIMEAAALSKVLHAIKNEKTLYIKTHQKNTTQKPTYHTTPNSAKLADIKQSGIIL